jgi:hypothetical protein
MMQVLRWHYPLPHFPDTDVCLCSLNIFRLFDSLIQGMVRREDDKNEMTKRENVLSRARHGQVKSKRNCSPAIPRARVSAYNFHRSPPVRIYHLRAYVSCFRDTLFPPHLKYFAFTELALMFDLYQ